MRISHFEMNEFYWIGYGVYYTTYPPPSVSYWVTTLAPDIVGTILAKRIVSHLYYATYVVQILLKRVSKEIDGPGGNVSFESSF